MLYPLSRPLATSAQVNVRLRDTSLLVPIGITTLAFPYAGKTVRERGGPPCLIIFFNSGEIRVFKVTNGIEKQTRQLPREDE